MMQTKHCAFLPQLASKADKIRHYTVPPTPLVTAVQLRYLSNSNKVQYSLSLISQNYGWFWSVKCLYDTNNTRNSTGLTMRIRHTHFRYLHEQFMSRLNETPRECRAMTMSRLWSLGPEENCMDGTHEPFFSFFLFLLLFVCYILILHHVNVGPWPWPRVRPF